VAGLLPDAAQAQAPEASQPGLAARNAEGAAQTLGSEHGSGQVASAKQRKRCMSSASAGVWTGRRPGQGAAATGKTVEALTKP